MPHHLLFLSTPPHAQIRALSVHWAAHGRLAADAAAGDGAHRADLLVAAARRTDDAGKLFIIVVVIICDRCISKKEPRMAHDH